MGPHKTRTPTPPTPQPRPRTWDLTGLEQLTPVGEVSGHHWRPTFLFHCAFTEFYENKGGLKLGEELDWSSLEKGNLTASTLRFPGKLAWDPAGKRLAISDTGQHRVLITDTSGVVEVRI